MGFPILSLIMLAPIIGAICILFVPEKEDKVVKVIAATFSSISLILATIAFVSYNKVQGGMQFLNISVGSLVWVSTMIWV